jgi:hypothetical protein
MIHQALLILPDRPECQASASEITSDAKRIPHGRRQLDFSLRLFFRQPLRALRCWSNWLAAMVAISVVSCTPGLSNLIGEVREAAASDRIMLVRSEPPSFGFCRLTVQASQYPDLGYFVTTHGLPDFLAETSSNDRHYLILYYLKKRIAFACRSKSARGHDVEFAGPYPVTDREFRMLDEFRRDPAKLPPG